MGRKLSEETREKIRQARLGHRLDGEHLPRDYPKLANLWQAMKTRCYNKNRSNYERYGGRGISVCDEWVDSSVPFIRWALDNGYRDGMQLDRIDNDADYSPDNCRWVTPKENSRNTRRNKRITLCGMNKTVAEWCETLDISEYTIYYWIREHGEKGCEKRIYERLASEIN